MIILGKSYFTILRGYLKITKGHVALMVGDKCWENKVSSLYSNRPANTQVWEAGGSGREDLKK